MLDDEDEFLRRMYSTMRGTRQATAAAVNTSGLFHWSTAEVLIVAEMGWILRTLARQIGQRRHGNTISRAVWHLLVQKLVYMRSKIQGMYINVT